MLAHARMARWCDASDEIDDRSALTHGDTPDDARHWATSLRTSIVGIILLTDWEDWADLGISLYIFYDDTTPWPTVDTTSMTTFFDDINGDERWHGMAWHVAGSSSCE